MAYLKRRISRGRKRIFKRRAMGRRAFRKRYSRRGRAPRQFNNYIPLGRCQSANHKYVDTIGLNAGVGVVADFIFSANGMYDPNITAVGHQPYGFDTMISMFDHWAVTGSKIKVTSTGSNTDAFWLMVALRDTSTSLSGTTVDVLLEQPNIHRVLIQPAQNPKSAWTTFSARKFFTTKDVVGSSELNGAAGANPTDQAYYHVMVAPFDASKDLVNQPVEVELNFHAVWSEPHMLTQS